LTGDTLSGNNAQGGMGGRGGRGSRGGEGGVGGIGAGGAIDQANASLSLVGDTLTGNTASGGHGGQGGSGTAGPGVGGFGGLALGGGLYTGGGVVNLINDTLFMNITQANSGHFQRSQGGAIDAGAGIVLLTNDTIADNVTLANNVSGVGGGVQNGSAFVSLQNTLVAQNTATTGPDFIGTVQFSDHNLIGNTSGSSGFSATNGDILNPASIGLGALANNGGPTQTLALQPGSPAIDTGDDAALTTIAQAEGVAVANVTDQTGHPRLFGAHIDIGAVEYPPVATALKFVAPPAFTAGLAGTVQVKVLDQFGNLLASDNSDRVTLSGAPFVSGSTTVTVQNGIATFSNLIISQAGTYTLSATSANLTAATSTSFTVTAAAITQPNDPGFEKPPVGSSYQVDPTGSPWTFAGAAGVAGNGSPVTSGNPNTPQGTQVAWMQNGGTISQAVNFAAGTYTISLDAAQRGNFPSHSSIQMQVDGQTVGTIAPAGTSYALYTTPSFTVTAGSHTIQFVGVGSGGSTALLDQVSIQAVSSSPPPAPPPSPPPVSVTQPSNPGFELSAVGNSYQMDPTGSPWTFAGAAGVAGNNSPVTSGNPAAPQGAQVAWMQNGGTVSQAVTFAAGSYTLSFQAAQRGNYPSNSSIQVQIDGQTEGTITPTGTSYASYTTNSFTVTAGSHTIRFVGVASGGSTALLDAVSIQTAPAGVDIHGQPHDAVVGQLIGPVAVAVVDASGNTVPGSNQLVTLSIASGPAGAVLSGHTTVRAIDGVATFAGLTLNIAGTYTLKATGGILTPDTSNRFTVMPADVRDDITVKRGGLHRHGSDGLKQVVTVTYTSQHRLDGPLALVLSEQPSDVVLDHATGSYQGNPYIDVLPVGTSLAPGQSLTVTLEFSFAGPGHRQDDDLSYSTDVLEGI
jgi:hypothetical protein